MGSKKSTSSSSSVMETNSSGTQSKQAFSSPYMKNAYNEFLNQAKDNYNQISGYTPQMLNNINNLNDRLSQYQNSGEIGDTSYFKKAWGQAQGIDQSNLKEMNSRELNAYKDPMVQEAIKASNEAARLAYGGAYDQANQNMIASGMRNGSGHQTAMAKVGAQLAANINAQNQQTYLARQNQLEQNALAANNQLGNFYNTLSNIGIDYARLNQQDLATLLNAYQTQSNLYSNMFNGQNSALNTYGNAILMGSDPTIVTDSHSKGTQETTNTKKESGGFGEILGGIVGGLGSAFTGFGK